MPIYAGAAGVTGFVRLELKVYDLEGALADPDDVAVTILLPDGTTSDESGNAVRESTGVYYLDYEPALVGTTASTGSPRASTLARLRMRSTSRT